MRNQKTVDFPLTLALSPRGKRVKLENQLRGERGQSQENPQHHFWPREV